MQPSPGRGTLQKVVQENETAGFVCHNGEYPEISTVYAGTEGKASFLRKPVGGRCEGQRYSKEKADEVILSIYEQ